MKTKTKLLIISHSVLAAIIIAQATVMYFTEAGVTYINSNHDCPTLEEQVRSMDADGLNKLLIVVSETFTHHYKEETRAQVEAEHEAYANSLALEHMNKVVGVLVKSIGDMPTSTLSVNE